MRDLPTTAPTTPVSVDPGFDLRSEHRGIGVLVPFDFALDRELWRWTPDNVTLYLTRMSFIDRPLDVRFAELISDPEDVERASRNLSAVDPDVMIYGCTSATFVNGLVGEQAVQEAIIAGGARKALTTSGALLTALAALYARKVAIATPYDDKLTDRLARFLEEAGYEVVSASNLGLQGHIAAVSQEGVVDLAMAAAHPDADVLFLSCTNLHTLDALPVLEERLDMPVLSANLVTMWASLRAIGALPSDPRERLFLLTHEWDQLRAWEEAT